MQSLIVFILVSGSTLYAAWKLMPTVARKAIAVRMLSLPLPGWLESIMRRAATVREGCACNGCERGAVQALRRARPASEQPAANESDASAVRGIHGGDDDGKHQVDRGIQQGDNVTGVAVQPVVFYRRGK